MEIIKLTSEQEVNLRNALMALASLMNSRKHSGSRCGCFHTPIGPDRNKFDKETADLIQKEVCIYVDTWIFEPLCDALNLDKLVILQQSHIEFMDDLLSKERQQLQKQIAVAIDKEKLIL